MPIQECYVMNNKCNGDFIMFILLKIKNKIHFIK